MTETARIHLLVRPKAARSDRLRGFGSGWLVSIALHATLLGAASLWIARGPARDESQLEEPVARLDLRIALGEGSGLDRAVETLPEAPAIARDVLPSFDAGALVEIEDARASDDAFWSEDPIDRGPDPASPSSTAIASARGEFSSGRATGGSASGSNVVHLPTRRGSGSGSGADRSTHPDGKPKGTPHGDTLGALGPPEMLSAPQPDYPESARRHKQEGDVRCLLHVDADGCVVRVDVVGSSGFSELDEAARTGLLRWRFRPATVGGLACACSVDHVVTFRLLAVHSRS